VKLLPDARLRAMTALGALTTTILVAGPPAPAGAAAPTARSAPNAAGIGASISDSSLRYGQALVVRGRLPGAGAGRVVALEHRTRGGAWRPVARALTGARGAFRLRARVERSGAVRVVAPDTAAGTATGVAPEPLASRARGVRVAALLTVARKRTTVRVGSRALVGGRVRPGTAGRRVVLQKRSGRSWRTIARTRTRRGGAFTLTARQRTSDSSRLRVVAAGTAGIVGTRRSAGRLDALRATTASWYGEGQALACGGHLTPGMMGVAHKSLPCGTKVTIRYRGRQVRVPIVDRGPYVGGREFDLGPGVRAALGFSGVGTVWVAH
jgi:hypothetical protein